jgi:simple sugar transport system ATP-binding protein
MHADVAPVHDGQTPGEHVPTLRARHVSKRFGGVVALDDVSMDVVAGEIAGLVGDNGAGKSTLIRIMSAVLAADDGTIELDGIPVQFSSPADARAAGIETVYQDLALAGNMPVWANIFLGRELLRGPRRLNILDKRRMATEADEMLSRLSRTMPPIDAPTALLSGGQRQAIAIARAAAWGSKVIIMDEPTAALGPAETRAVEEVIAGLRDRGFAVLIISHNLEQIFRLADSVWVLRRGRMIGHRRLAETTPEEVVAMITGASAVLRGQAGERP